VTLLDFVRLSRAHVWSLLFLTLVGAGSAWVITERMPEVYLADASGYVVVGGDQQTSGEGLAATTLGGTKADSYLPLVTGRAVAQGAIEATGIDATPAQVAARVSATVAPESVILNVTATGPNPEEARVLADAVIVATSREADRIEKTGRSSTTGRPLVQIVPIETALPGVKIAPDPLRNVLIGAVVGLLVAYGLVFLRRQLDTRLRTVADVEAETGASVLGVVPLTPELRGHASRGLDQLGLAAEAFRQVRTNLRFVSVDHAPRSIVVTSANAGEGKSTMSATLARVLGESGQPTVIIDADLRRPMLATIFDRPGSVGLSQLLYGQVRLADALQETEQPNVQLIAAGRTPPNPSELLGSQRMHALIDHLAKDHLVILDAPPLLPVTDAGLLSGMSDGTLLVFAVGRTHKEQARLCAKIMGQVGGHVLGVVLNMAPKKGLGGVVYGYGHGYGSEYSTREKYLPTPGDTHTGADAAAVAPISPAPRKQRSVPRASDLDDATV
jgi:polysaccharide biosynthesis transport protein